MASRPGRAMSAAIVAGALVALWWTISFTASMVLAPTRPEAALRAWTTGTAESTLAATLASRPVPRPVLLHAEALSRAALRRSPVDAMAARALALTFVQLGHYAAGRWIIGYAETLSRRDQPTQLWLIEDRVQAGDVAGALRHYDRAMLTSVEIRPFLMPVLAQASDDARVTRALLPFLYPRPEWWSDFLGRFLEVARSPDGVYAVGMALRLDPTSDIDHVRIGTVVQKLVTLGDFAAARRFYAATTGDREARAATVVDGGFEHSRDLAPLDWQLTDAEDHAGVVEAREGQDGRAALTLSGSEGQEDARQLIGLAPGSYTLRAKVGALSTAPGTPPTATIVCAGPSTDVLAVASFPTGVTGAMLTADWAVPASGCPTQWLILSAGARAGSGGDSPWIDSIVVRRRAAS